MPYSDAEENRYHTKIPKKITIANKIKTIPTASLGYLPLFAQTASFAIFSVNIHLYSESIMSNPASKTSDQLKIPRRPLRNVNVEHRESLTRLEKLALFITTHVGSMGFFLLVLSWTVLWLSWNTLAPKPLRFDPFPAFVLWLFISNVIQLLLMPLIMVGQNLQGRHAEARAESDFVVNVKAEDEIETILLRLEHQNQLILEILRHLEGREKP